MTTNPNPTLLAAAADNLGHGITATIAYFALALLIFGLGFGIQDLLTPGKLRQLVFEYHRPNAGVMVASQAIAIGLVLGTAIATSDSSDLLGGLAHVAIYGLIGLVLQSLFLVILEALIPGRFRDLVMDPTLRSSAVVTGVFLVVVGAINAICLT